MTRYIDEMNITAYQQSRWQDLARCIWCGFKSPDSGQCVCRYCDSCSRVWFSSVLADYKDEDTGPVSRWEYCPDCIASLCVDCGLSACHDVHDSMITGAGKHPFNDGECRALVPYDSRFLRFDWGTVADAAEQAMINECKKLNRQFKATMEVVREANRVLAA